MYRTKGSFNIPPIEMTSLLNGQATLFDLVVPLLFVLAGAFIKYSKCRV